MDDIERALAQISDIRAQLAATTRFRGYGPQVLAGVAAASALVMAAQMVWPDVLAASNLHHVVVWGALLLLSNLAIGVEAIARAQWQHGGMAQAMLHSALGGQLPFLAASAIIAIGLCRFAPGAAWIVPGIWQLLIALVAFSSQAIMPPAIVWAGAWYAMTGTLAIVLAGSQGQFAPWMMGVPLFFGHLLIAWALRQEGDEHHG